MRDYLLRCRFFFVHAGILSFFINLFHLAIPLYWLQVFDRVMSSRSFATLAMLTVLVLWVLVFMHMLEIQRSNLLARAGVALDDFLAGPVLQRQLDTGMKPVGQHSEDSLADVARLRSFLSGSAVVAFFDLPWGIFFLALMFAFHPALGAVTLFGAALLGVLTIVEERATARPLAEAAATQLRATRFVQNATRNAEVAGAMGMAGALSRRWEIINGKVKSLQLQLGHTIGLISSIGRFTKNSLRIVALGVGVYLIINEQMTPGLLLAATMILNQALSPIDSIIRNWRNLSAARIAYGRLSRLLGENVVEAEKLVLPEPEGRLEVEKLYFRFGQAEPLLRNMSFSLEPGESLGIIGPSGAGKTTLVRLLNGLWVPSSGAVRLDGAEIHAWDKNHLGRYIGYLPQDVELFDGSVAENVCRLGEVEQWTDQIVAAAKLARAHELILRLPKGYDTPMGEGGVRLSGGQRQRIALARALFGTPKLIVLDEPNSNLDTEGEQALMEALRDIRKAGITTICITHKLNLLSTFDKTLLLKDDGSYQLGRTREVAPRLSAPPATPALQAPAENRSPAPPSAAPAARNVIKGMIGKVDDAGIRGWAYFPAQPETVPVLEIYMDEELLGTTEAKLFRGDLAQRDIGTGYHGFEFKFPPERDFDSNPGDRLKVFVLIPGGDKVVLPKA
ncbi:MAG: ATP-binding cassette subfamily C bacterial exporter for protease/lipase [Rhodocyclaceae bacterium]|nr:MAG: ATP-binding cassette subfamily C bacterial exporter for protease/lipase [Rhodocyclaceae bacterium]TNC98494.1 MAG: ATP-binding cassette, subfamily C, bacterial exporter for protease/lipase [Rhodocyclaceae bacterium]